MRLLVNAVRVDGGQQIADDPSEFDTAGLFLDPFLLLGVELPVEPGEAAGKGTHRVFVVRTHHHTHGEILERHGGLRNERLAGGLERFCDADGVNDHIVGLPADSGGRDFLEIVMVEGAGAAALHLLEIVAASHVAHEDQAFERLDVGARGDHVHGHGDAWIVVVSELGEDGFRILLGLVGDLLAELVAFGEFLAHGLDDVVGVAVGLGENKRLRDFGAAGEYLRPLVAEGADDSANLVGVDDVAIKLLGGIGDILILNLPALPARQAFAFLDLLPRLELAAVPGLLRIDGIDFAADIDAVGDGLFMVVFADDVLSEEAVGAVVRRGGQADEAGVEIFQDLPPEIVDRAVAFVDDDEVEEFRWNLAVIDNRHRLFRLNHFRRVDLLGGFIHLPVLQERVHALDGTDADLAVPGDEGRFQPLDVVEFREFPVVVIGHIGHEFLLGLFAEVLGVYEKEDAPGVSVFEQPVDRSDGSIGLAGAGRHLNERARAVILEGCLKLLNGIDLARPEARGVQVRKPPEPRTQRDRLVEPVPYRLRPEKVEYLP